MLTFRDVFRDLTPAWLHTGEGEKVLHAQSTLLDSFALRARLALVLRFPSMSSPSSIALIGDDRGILRGREESHESYAARLIAWRYPRGHRVRGSAWGLLEQAALYFGGIKAFTIDVKGTKSHRDENGVETTTYGVPWDWDGAGSSPNWARFWLVLDMYPEVAVGPSPDFGDPLLWGGELGLPGYAIGHTGVSPEDANAIRRLFTQQRSWQPAGTRPEWAIIPLDDADVTPDGTWLNWSRLDETGTQVATRYAGWRYWSLSPEQNNTYAGDPESYCTLATLPDGSLYGGDPDNYPEDVTLPDGSTYAGDPASYPVSVRLHDDGDPARA